MGARGQTQAERAIVASVRAALGRRPVVLIGSRATGDERPDSDYDVYVVLPAQVVPFAIPRLHRASRELERKLQVPVSLNALPRFRLKRPGRTLIAWKLYEEGRVLYAPDHFALEGRAASELPHEALSSYALSGLRFLLDGLEPRALEADRLPAELRSGVRKALLHGGQLVLLQHGSYTSTTAGAAAALEKLGYMRLATLLAEHGGPDAWFSARDLLLERLQRPSSCSGRALAANLQYVGLSLVRGRRRSVRALLRSAPIRDELHRTAVAVASAVMPGGRVDQRLVLRAHNDLPEFLRPPRPEWSELRDVIEDHWPDAEPLVGI